MLIDEILSLAADVVSLSARLKFARAILILLELYIGL